MADEMRPYQHFPYSPEMAQALAEYKKTHGTETTLPAVATDTTPVISGDYVVSKIVSEGDKYEFSVHSKEGEGYMKACDVTCWQGEPVSDDELTKIISIFEMLSVRKAVKDAPTATAAVEAAARLPGGIGALESQLAYLSSANAINKIAEALASEITAGGEMRILTKLKGAVDDTVFALFMDLVACYHPELTDKIPVYSGKFKALKVKMDAVAGISKPLPEALKATLATREECPLLTGDALRQALLRTNETYGMTGIDK